MNKKQFDINNDLPVLEITSSEDALIRIDRLPAVEEFFSTMYEPVSQRINAVLSAECTEETRLDAEKSRAEIRQFKADIKAALKKAESQLYEPWERVLEKAQNLTNLCDKADSELKSRIDAVKDKLKKEKFDELVIYYNEKCSVLGLEWLEIDRVIPCIRLNDSLSKLRKALDETLEKIYADVSAISTMDNAPEIMAEYKACLDLPYSIKIVQTRHSLIESEKRSLEEQADTKAKEAEHAEGVLNAAKANETKSEQLQAPTAKPSSEAPTATEEKRYTMSFTVSGTLEELKALKRFILENNIKIIE